VELANIDKKSSLGPILAYRRPSDLHLFSLCDSNTPAKIPSIGVLQIQRQSYRQARITVKRSLKRNVGVRTALC
jgi:hypothetical protein